jgi:hypothetical protein
MISGLHFVVAAVVVVVTLAALRLLWASRGWPLVHDAPLMHYIAARILEGAVPYRDLFDMNLPGVYMAHTLLLATLGPGDLAFRAFDLGILAVVATGLWAAVRVSGPWGGLAAAALFALAWSAARVIASMQGFAPESGLARVRRLGGAAIALGAAFCIKPHAALLVPFLGWAALRGPMRGRALAPVGIGVALPVAAMLGWLGWTGGLPSFVDVTLGYLVPLYGRLGRSSLFRELAERDYGMTVLAGLAIWAALGALALARGRRGGTLAVLGTGLAYGVAHFWVQGRGWDYHFYPLAMFAVALGGAGLGAALADGRRLLTALLVLALALTTGALWTKGQRNVAPAWIEAKMSRVARLSAALRPLVAAGGTVQVLDTSEGGIHALFRLRVRQPSRFLYDFHFHHDVSHPYVRRLRAELMGALRATPPVAVVVFERGWPAGGYERLAGFPELQRWLLEGYRLAEEGDGYRLYVGRSGVR